LVDHAGRGDRAAVFAARALIVSPTLRAATADDYAAFARFHVELEVPDPVPSLERWRGEICASAIMVVEHDAPIGYGSWLPLGELGHVRHVVVDASARGRGVGRMIMDALAQRMHAAGHARWQLYVKEENVAGRRLYENCGMGIVARSTALELRWEDVERLPRGRTLHRAPPVPALGVSAATLAAWQQQADAKIEMLVDDHGVIAGIVRLDPEHPGVRPFTVDAPDAIRPMLEALRPHKRAADPSLRLVVDDREDVCACLTAAGASVLLRLLRYQGELT
jgi:ribosomal protein S18 acetylase RimI-like enzyme